jgi:RimJ/RimL family protein N-acetyltransferase
VPVFLRLDHASFPGAPLIAQPDVHRYLSSAREIAADPAGQAARIVTVATEQWANRGYGPFALFEKGSDVLIGRGGLFWIEALQDVEINYMFDPTVWGRGYATEAPAEFLAIGFDRHDLARMVATTNPANVASAHVLQKVGMKVVGKKDLGGGARGRSARDQPRSLSRGPSCSDDPNGLA